MHLCTCLCTYKTAYLTKFPCFSKYELVLKYFGPWVFTDKFCIPFWCADPMGWGEEKYIT